MKRLLKFACLVSAVFGLTAARADVFVSGTGDDVSGAGTAESPWRSITKAVTEGGSLVIRVDEGTYTAKTGETFPIVLPDGAQLVGWAAEGEADRSLRVIDGAKGVANLLTVTGAGEFLVKGLTFKDAKRESVVIKNASGTVDDCAFSSCPLSTSGLSTDEKNYAGGIAQEDDGVVTVTNSLFSGIVCRRGCIVQVGAETTDYPNRKLTIAGCTFTASSNTLACVSTAASNRGPYCVPAMEIRDCLFLKNTTAAGQNVQYGDMLTASVLAIGSSSDKVASRVSVEGCRFVGNTGNYLFTGAKNFKNTINVSKCLFVDNVTTRSEVYGYQTLYAFTDCTFVRDSGGFNGRMINSSFDNCIFEGVGPLSQADITKSEEYGQNTTSGHVTLGKNVFHDTPLGIVGRIYYSDGTAASSNLLVDPRLANATVPGDDPAFDARPRADTEAAGFGYADAYTGAPKATNAFRIGEPIVYLASGETLELAVRTDDPIDTAANDVTVSLSEPTGEGTSTIGWTGGAEISAGGQATEGRLVLTGGTGVRKATLTLEGGTFVESGEAALTVTVVGRSGDLFVDPSAAAGGDGTATAPFRTVTEALAHAVDGDTVHLASGTYSPATGETFPLEPHGVRLVGAGETTVLDGQVEVWNVINYGTEDRGLGSSVGQVKFTSTVGPAILVDGAEVCISNAFFTQTLAVSDSTDANRPGGIHIQKGADVTISGCTFSGSTHRRACIYIHESDSSASLTKNHAVRVLDCTFSGNALEWGAFACRQTWARLSFERCLFESNVINNATAKPHDSHSGAALYLCGRSDGSYHNQTQVRRCRFVGNKGPMLIGAQSCGIDASEGVNLDNCLFVDNVGKTGSLTGGYNTLYRFRHCTFVRNTGGFTQRTATASFENCGLADNGDLARYSTAGSYQNSIGLVTIKGGCALFNTGKGESSYVSMAGDEPLTDDPCLEDCRPLPYSPWVDAGVELDVGETDLDGQVRVADNTGLGTARADIGCFESLYNAAVVPTVQFPDRAKGNLLRGATANVTLSLLAYDGPYPVTARVGYGEGLTGPESVTFEGETASLPVKADPSGEAAVARVTVAADGFASGLADFSIADGVSLSVGGRMRFAAKVGETVRVSVRMAEAGATAPSDIELSIADKTGAGEADWSGSPVIPEGADEAEGVLEIASEEEGEARVTVATAEGTFAETGGSTVEIRVSFVATDGGLAVDPENGDDDNPGTSAQPLRTIGAALALGADVGLVELAEGVYSAESGEAFPLEPHGIAIVGAGEGTVIDAGNAAEKAVVYANDRGDRAGLLANLTLRNTTAELVSVGDSDVVLSNCVFRQTLPGSGFGALNCMNDSNARAVGCSFEGFERASVVRCAQAVPSYALDRSLLLEGCVFADNVCANAAIDSALNATYVIQLTDCAFLGNDNADPDRLLDEMYASSCIHFAQGNIGNSTAPLHVDRCTFAGNGGGVLLGGYGPSDSTSASSPLYRALRISNSLFVENEPKHGMFGGYNCTGYVWGCTFVRNAGCYTGRYFNSLIDNCVFMDELNPICSYLLDSTKTWNNDPRTSGKATFGRNVVFGSAYYDDTMYPTEKSLEPKVVFSEDQIEADPRLKRADVAWDDPHFSSTPKADSPCARAANAAAFFGTVDLSGEERDMSRPSIGCLEAMTPGLILFIR